eukprot:Sdes_comp18232_c0_seq3m7827
MFSRIFSPVAFRRITQPFISQSYASEAAASTSSSSSHVKLTFTAPGQAFYKNSPVDQINVPSTAGDFGILPSHVPSIAILRPGLVSVLTSGSLKSYFGACFPLFFLFSPSFSRHLFPHLHQSAAGLL